MTKRLFITGMFRSGTTLLARMLDAHEEIACASDPFSPFFKSFRNAVADEVGADLRPEEPFGDYFADLDEGDLFEAVEGATLDRPLADNPEALRERIVERGRAFSPLLMNRLESIEGETYREVYDHLLSHVQPTYGTGEETWIGTKETWLSELVPALASAYSEAKFVLIVRDPRAVTASKNVNENERYPWLFLLRQWRKLAGLNWTYATESEFANRVYLLRFEDLVTQPERIGSELCDFLEVPVDEDILDPSTFTDGSGEQWLQNTSYEDSKAEFNTDSVDRWKQVHPDRIVRFVEQLCFADMELLGYESREAQEPGIDGKYLRSPPTVDLDSMADWIQPYYRDRTPVSHRNDLARETIRTELISATREELRKVEPRVIEAYFLKRAYFNALQKVQRGEFDPVLEESV